jgi:hypothetical protein
MDPLREELEEALTMVRCPYYQREGVCATGCWDEPACVVNRPTGGWEAEIESLRKELVDGA